MSKDTKIYREIQARYDDLNAKFETDGLDYCAEEFYTDDTKIIDESGKVFNGKKGYTEFFNGLWEMMGSSGTEMKYTTDQIEGDDNFAIQLGHSHMENTEKKIISGEYQWRVQVYSFCSKYQAYDTYCVMLTADCTTSHFILPYVWRGNCSLKTRFCLEESGRKVEDPRRHVHWFTCALNTAKVIMLLAMSTL